jgi:hypothetical protein
MTPIKFGNVWVVGQDNLEGWFKMVSFNKYGNQIESRYLKARSTLNEGSWNKANRGPKYFYNVENVMFTGDSAIANKATLVDSTTGLKYNNLTPIKFGATWVVGTVVARKDWLKMVSFDLKGRQIESRYSKPSNPFREGTWMRANRANKYYYNVENVMFNGDTHVPSTATLVDNVGAKFANKKPIKFGNVWVIGQDNTGGWFKMVSFDTNGNQVESRYMKVRSKFHEGTWNSATRNSKYAYHVQNVIFPGQNIANSATLVDNVGNRFPNRTPAKFGNVWVIGKDNLGGWYKMVSFDKKGSQIESRYMKIGSKFN